MYQYGTVLFKNCQFFLRVRIRTKVVRIRNTVAKAQKNVDRIPVLI